MDSSDLTSEKAGRLLIHSRQIQLHFYKLPDGLYEVEGTLTDRKTHRFRRQLASVDTLPGEALHDITVTLTFDDAMQVLGASACMRSTPFGVCQGAQETLKPLIGLTMGGGWNKAVRSLLGGQKSCTHIVELLGPMATTAYQGLAPFRIAKLSEPGNEAGRLAKVDSCYAYGAERTVVAQLWPHLHRRTGPWSAQGISDPSTTGDDHDLI